MAAPRITVVVPTFYPGADLPPLLDALLAQRLPDPFDILVVDSGSPPAHLAPLAGTRARRLDIPPGSFGHGRTRNLAAAATQAELVAFLTQDALPADDGWLAGLVDALDAHPEADGAYSRQRPRPDADAAVAERLAAAFPDGPARVQRMGDGWASLPPAARLARARYDHVSALTRRAALLARPLPDVPFGEDLAWALATLQAGRSLVYAPASQVIHSHRRGPAETFRRTREEHRALAAWLGLRAVPDLAHLARGAGSVGARAIRRLMDGAGPSEVVGEGLRLAAELAGQYAGGRHPNRIDNLTPGR